MFNLPLDPASLILAVGAIIAILLYFREHDQRKRLESDGEKYLEEMQQKGWETLHQSIQKSQNILGQAELEGIKVAAGSKVEISKFEADFAAQLTQSLKDSQQTITESQAKFLEFMQDLQKRSLEFEEASKAAGEKRINQLFERVENRLSDFLVQTGQQATSSINLELKAARQLIDTYKNQQLKLIDENIIAMMEQTLNLVISKNLSLKDHLDLVYEALEKAKVQKFIV